MNKYCYSQNHSPQVVFRDKKFTSNDIHEGMSNDALYM